jgi:capsular polysaccharide biosynthesis protein
MKIPASAMKALREQDAKITNIEMTDELRDKWSKIANQVIDILTRECKNPIEARMVLEHIVRSWDETFDIKSVIITEKGEGGEA